MAKTEEEEVSYFKQGSVGQKYVEADKIGVVGWSVEYTHRQHAVG